MTDYLIKKQTLTDIADAIRDKKGYPSTTTFTPAQMADEIESITTSSGENVQPEQTITPSKSQQIVPHTGYTAVRKVTVNPIPSDYIIPSGAYPETITSNGTYTVTKYETVIVDVPTNIPSGYHDTSGVTATAATVLSTYKFVDKDGNLKEGAIPNKGAVSVTLDASSKSYTIPLGYHNGEGKVSVKMPEDYDGDIDIT